MRNTVLVLLGQSLEASARELMKYTLQYGEASVTDYLQVAVWRPADTTEPAAMSAALCQRIAHSQAEFCSDLSSDYDVEIGQRQSLHDDEEVRLWWSSLFGRTVTLQHQGDSTGLNLCLVVKLWEEDMVLEALRIARILREVSHKFVVDVLAVPPTIATVFDDDIALSAQMSRERTAMAQSHLQQLVTARQTLKTLHAVVMFEGTNTQGIALNMQYQTWLRLVGEYAMIATENYPTLFPHNLDLQGTDVTTFGLSILDFDRSFFVHYLLRRAYLKILGRERVQQTEVDINKVAAIAQEQLLRHHHRFTGIYHDEVQPMLSQGKTEKDILAAITTRVSDETAQMERDFQSYIESEELSLPEKQATLAQLLGLNDELYVGNLFARDQLFFEDCGSDVIDTFVQENNALGDQGVLTMPRHPETGQVYSPIHQLKASRLRITESDRYIRIKQAELEQFQTQITETQQSQKRLTTDGFVFGDETYRFMDDNIEPHLFDEDYEPKPVPVESVDMRPMFTQARSQGQLPACSIFAITSVYEFLLKKLRKDKTDLSEHFLYYNLSVQPDGTVVTEGKSFFDVTKSMSEQGICLEELCPYDGTLSKPSPEAYADARNHLVKKVKNVRLTSDLNKNHLAITSALAEGYPVIIALHLYESFCCDDSGFVPRPSPDERQHGDHGCHAMVICGFSNEEKVYIVRNSWGQNFGVEGYCYIPFSYIDDHEFCRQACIITQIAESDMLSGFETDQMHQVSFSTTDASIRYSITRNLIEEEKLKLEQERLVYQQLATSYYRLTSDLGNNSLRRQILSGAEERLRQTIQTRQEEKDNFLRVEYAQQLQAVRTESRSGKLIIGVIFLVWLLFMIVMLSYETLRNWAERNDWITFGCVGAIILIVYAWYTYYRRSVYNNKERELNHRRDQMAQQVRQLERELASKHLKLHIAGMFIDSINRVQHVLDHKYKVLRGYVGNLAKWMACEQETIDQMKVETQVPFVPVIRSQVLDQYFQQHQDDITQSIRLYSFLDTAGLSDRDIVAFKYGVRNKIAQSLQSQYRDFSILEYLLGHQYPYLPQQATDVASLMRGLDQQSDCFLQLTTTGRLDECIHSRYVLVSSPSDALRQQWQTQYPQYFQHRPSDVTTFTSPTRLIELQVRHIPVKMIDWMQPLIQSFKAEILCVTEEPAPCPTA